MDKEPGFVKELNEFYEKNKVVFLKNIPSILSWKLVELFGKTYRLTPPDRSLALELFENLLKEECLTRKQREEDE